MVEGVRSWGNRLAVAGIEGYQKHLSPRKGWHCAHRVLYGGESCSQWIKIAITEHGCRSALPLIRARFTDCKSAAHVLRAATPENYPSADEDKKSASSSRKRRRKRRHDVLDCCGPNWPCDLFMYWPSGCGRGTLARASDAACDCGPGDTGCVDCSPCSCIP